MRSTYLPATAVCSCVHMYVMSPLDYCITVHQQWWRRVPVCMQRSKRLVISFLFHLHYLVLANTGDRQLPSFRTKCTHTHPCCNAITGTAKGIRHGGTCLYGPKQCSVPGRTAAFFSQAHRKTLGSGWVARRRHHALGILAPESVVQLVHGNQVMKGCLSQSPYNTCCSVHNAVGRCGKCVHVRI